MAENRVLKVVIADDEPDARNLLRSSLGEIGNVELVGEAKHSEEAFYLISEKMPDVVLLDVNMPGKSGLELTHLLNKRMVDIPLIFISGHKEYAVEAIRQGVYDFLLKPVSTDELKKVLDKYRLVDHRSFPDKIAEIIKQIPDEVSIKFNTPDSYVFYNPSEIVYCRSRDGFVNIYLANGKEELTTMSLSQIAEKVADLNFFRLGRSLLVNLDYVRAIDKSADSCLLKSDTSSWEVTSSHQAIKEMLQSCFNHA